jgi:hypothetical protein
VLTKAARRAAELEKGNSVTPDTAFLALPSLPDLHFLGVALDCGLRFDLLFGSPTAVIYLVRAKELAQAKLTEAIATQQIVEESKKRAEALAQAQPSYPPAATGTDAQDPQPSSAECADGVAGDPELILLSSLCSSSKRKKKMQVDFGPRTNLTDTPARQARAFASVQQ